jgi:hypothetical protein
MGEGTSNSSPEGVGDFSLQPAVYEAIVRLVPERSTILELGSGEGDRNLIDLGFRVQAVEHDPAWVGVVPGVEYIHAPLSHIKPTRWHPTQDRWYDSSLLKAKLPALKYDLVIVDGPPGDVGRGGFLKYFNLFDGSVPWILDDIHRFEEWKMIRVLSDKLGKNILIPPTGTERLFAVIGTGEQLGRLL